MSGLIQTHSDSFVKAADKTVLDYPSLEDLFLQCLKQNHSSITTILKILKNPATENCKQLGFISAQKNSGVTLFSLFTAFYLHFVQNENVIFLTSSENVSFFKSGSKKMSLRIVDIADITVDWLKPSYQEELMKQLRVTKLVIDGGSLEKQRSPSDPTNISTLSLLNNVENTFLVLKKSDFKKKSILNLKATLEQLCIQPMGMISHEI